MDDAETTSSGSALYTDLEAASGKARLSESERGYSDVDGNSKSEQSWK